MKFFFHALGGAVALGLSLSAVAGPDWYVIEKARNAKRAEAQQLKAQQAEDHTAMRRDHAAMMQKCREMMGQPK
ncbi:MULTISPECIES: hypothetical protein [Cupriavidus]|jgi:hypothetical protein|uniref:Lipoprotein n=4 Tax=Cupriavidus TaxID=106589 RepID=A0A7Z7NRB1_9BURK|nr:MULTISPECIES: hypothetical protein [Cupriavidus]AMR78394.1 hypothetical protein A2G96_11980 [Cupriavidus nantongensis]KAB0595306.1 hypothetical protein F7Q96_18570 [Cupriavidus gilardii]MBO4120609.1 hypothetical protein [Cupriavidus gilardii]MCT9074146.1 hypothetical protein [Cupriavidus gilardii]NNH11994.1 hypothetical protein [Cupriavidus gilardii]